MALLQWILMLSVFGISHLAYLLSFPNYRDSALEDGPAVVPCIPYGNHDIMQFIWGKLLGRHKILPK